MRPDIRSGALRMLVLGSYPVARPIHGGQIRLSEILRAYRAAGVDTRLVSIWPDQAVYRNRLTWRWRPGARTQALDFALAADVLNQYRGQRAPFIEDLASGDFIAGDEERVRRIERFCAGPLDWVHVEQPWLLPLALRLRERGRLGEFQLVYGSQNIEHGLKRAILQQYGVAADVIDAVTRAVRTLEQQAAAEARIVAAVTRDDAAWLAGYAGGEPVLAANGVRPWRAAPAALARWRARLGSEPFGLFVASAHPPNITGFCESFGESLAALSPTQRIVIAGSVAEHVLASGWFRRWEALNRRRVVALGMLDAADLDAVRELAGLFVVPVTRGGGSNLKTAEALYSGQPVVATPHAMRGFEHLSDLAGVVVAEPGGAFARAVHDGLSRLPASRQPVGPSDGRDARGASSRDRARREALTWSSTLADLTASVIRAGQAVPA